MKFKKLMCILLVSVSAVHAMDIETSLSDFDRYAHSYGNKAANLRELSNFIKGIPATIPIQVPTYFDFSDEEMKQFLIHDEMYDELMKLWNQFKSQQSQTDEVLTQPARHTLAQIRQLVGDDVDWSQLFDQQYVPRRQDATSGHQQKDALQFLHNAESNHQLLVVRSTGREDSKELANAGGNESIAFVEPRKLPVGKAIGIVVASYFSEKSIGQRLAARDRQLFEDPFIPVILQNQIGEPITGAQASKQIPVSGVMFSQEAEGRTPVVQIQSTFGQGEGIVNGLVAFDTYYSGPSNIVHSLIGVKPERILIGKKIDNPKELIRRSSLTLEQVLALSVIARKVQQYYGYPVDIEFVVQNNVIYLVQARPLQEPQVTPSYVKEAYIKQVKGIVPLFVIGAAGGRVRIIEHKSQVIITDTIGSALTEFLASPHKNEIKAVIVGQNAPSTSHEATTFRALSKPVVYLENLEVAKGLAIPYMLDTQRSMLIPFIQSNEFSNPDQAIEEDGWLAHPIPKKTSLMLLQVLEKKIYDNLLATTSEFFPGQSATALLEIIKAADPDQALKAALSLVARVNKLIAQVKQEQRALITAGRQTNIQLGLILEKLKYALLSATYELSQSLHQWSQTAKTSRDRLIRLYPAVFIEALIRQVPQIHAYVDDYSLASVTLIEKQEQEAVRSLNILGIYLPQIAQYAKAAQYALNDEIKSSWNNLLSGLAHIDDPILQAQFSQLIKSLTELNILPMWINTSFSSANQNRPAQEIASQLITEHQEVAQHLEKLQAVSKQLKLINVAAFGNPETNKQQLQILLPIIKSLISPEFLRLLEMSNPLIQAAALNIMREGTNIFDGTIKTVTGSTIIPLEQKLKLFKQLLFEYLRVLAAWGELIDGREMNRLMRGKALGDDNSGYSEQDRLSFKEMVQFLGQRIVSAPLNAQQLYPRNEFNVAALILGSPAFWGHQKIDLLSLRLEELFTLIHQNILVVLSVLNEEVFQRMPIPNKLSAFVDENLRFKRRFTNYYDVDYSEFIHLYIVGIDFTYPELIYHFNLPLGEHSALIALKYNLIEETAHIEISFFGSDEESRWNRMYARLILYSFLFDLDFVQQPKIYVTGTGLSFTWDVKNAQQAEIMSNLLLEFAEATYEENIQHPINFPLLKKYLHVLHVEDLWNHIDSKLRNNTHSVLNNTVIASTVKKYLMDLNFAEEELADFNERDINKITEYMLGAFIYEDIRNMMFASNERDLVMASEEEAQFLLEYINRVGPSKIVRHLLPQLLYTLKRIDFVKENPLSSWYALTLIPEREGIRVRW